MPVRQPVHSPIPKVDDGPDDKFDEFELDVCELLEEFEETILLEELAAPTTKTGSDN